MIHKLGVKIRKLTKGKKIECIPFLDETLVSSKNLGIIKNKREIVNNILEGFSRNEEDVFVSSNATVYISGTMQLSTAYFFIVGISNKSISADVELETVEMPSAEMVNWFNRRTKEHIERVKNNLLIIGTWFDFDKKELEERAVSHDQSKYSDAEKEPYIWLSWNYKEKEEKGKEFKYPPGVAKRVKEATLHHITVNSHHPEAHESVEDMNNLDIAEMIADLAAMSQELGTSLKDWVNKVTLKKYKWTSYQKKLIIELTKLFLT